MDALDEAAIQVDAAVQLLIERDQALMQCRMQNM
jgi:hypothetical protein